ncbi:MFS transporter [Jannaschia formosa]|uniref:MFS transporter n=1 Tax=Jannaschia formosa TaxID=2259592 RepID=UPI000E1BE853|nr:MFS transporter [Jannaschia formosa]TFL18820.1 MFS transporter [Jannaschia formosa]
MTVAPTDDGPRASGTSSATGLTLFALLASATLTVMAGATIAPSLPGLVAHFAGDPRAEWLVPFILTAPGLAIAVAAPLSGMLVDRTVKRRVLLGGIALYVLAGSSGLYLDTLDAILIGRLFLGLAVGAVMTASIALIADIWEGEARQRVLGWQAASMGVGGILFIGSGGLLGQLDWRGPFAVYLAPLVLIPIVLRAVPATPPRPRGPAGAPAARFPWRHALPIYAVGAAAMLTFYVIPTLIPFVVAELVGVERASAWTGAVVAASMVASSLASTQVARIRRRLSPHAVGAISFAVVAVGYVAISTHLSIVPLTIALAGIGAGLGLMMPTNNAWLLSGVPDAMRGRASGGMTMSLFLAQFSSAFVGGALVAWGGLDFVYAAMGAFAAVLAGLLLLWARAAR